MSDDPSRLEDGKRRDFDRLCAWCQEPIPSKMRKDAETCSPECRQARHRFRISPAPPTSGATLRFAVGDPPYVGLAKRYYGDHPAFGGEVDHAELIARMGRDFPDGWALCASEDSLHELMLLCPRGVRVAIWVKGSRRGESYRARNAYEPVILWGGRPIKMSCDEVLDDVLIWGGRQHSHPGALVGMKPAPFCEWVFRQLGALAGDELVDLFPGSGAIGRAWTLYSGRSEGPPPHQLDMFGDNEAKRRASGLPSRLQEASRAAGVRLESPEEPATEVAALSRSALPPER